MNLFGSSWSDCLIAGGTFAQRHHEMISKGENVPIFTIGTGENGIGNLLRWDSRDILKLPHNRWKLVKR